jgi:hypothetical protein
MTRHAFPATIGAVCLLLAGLFLATPAPAKDEHSPIAERNKARAADELDGALAAEREILGAEFPGLDLEKVPLIDAVDAMRHASRQDIFVNWKAVEAAGVRRDTPVSIVLRNKTTLGTAMHLLLDVAAGGRDRLGLTVDDGVITVSTTRDLAKNTLTRVYDVRDLVGPDDGQRERRVGALNRLLRTTIDPKSWRDNGGEGSTGALRELQGQIIVTQTPENQDAIKALLEGVSGLLHPEKDAAAAKEFPVVSTKPTQPAR